MIDWTLFAYLVGGSAAAIAALGVLMHLLGRSRRLTAGSNQEAAALFAEDFPGFETVEVALSPRGDMALLAFSDDPAIGVLRAMGTHWMSRLIRPGEVASVRQTRKGSLHITLHDFADPLIVVTLKEDEDSMRWLALLENLKAPRGPEPSDGRS